MYYQNVYSGRYPARCTTIAIKKILLKTRQTTRRCLWSQPPLDAWQASQRNTLHTLKVFFFFGTTMTLSSGHFLASTTFAAHTFHQTCFAVCATGCQLATHFMKTSVPSLLATWSAEAAAAVEAD